LDDLFDWLGRLFNELILARGGAFLIIEAVTSGALGFLVVDTTDDIGILGVVETVDVVGKVEAVEKDELLVIGETVDIAVVMGSLPVNPGGGVGLFEDRPLVSSTAPRFGFCMEVGGVGAVAAAATAAKVVKAESACA